MQNNENSAIGAENQAVSVTEGLSSGSDSGRPSSADSSQSAQSSMQPTTPADLPSAKKNAGEAFQELKSAVMDMNRQILSVSHFVSMAREVLDRYTDDYVWEGKLKVLESVFRIHDLLYTRVTAMEAGSLEPDSFLIDLLAFIRDLLSSHDIEIILPQPGERFDVKYMEAISSSPAKLWRSPNTVASVQKCGYLTRLNESQEKVLQPARVFVYKKAN